MDNLKTSVLLEKELQQLRGRLRKESKLLSSGYAILDCALGGHGFESGTITTLGARPGMGKTIFALNIVYNQLAILPIDCSIIYVSCRDDRSFVLKRLICIATKTPEHLYETAALDLAEENQISSHPFLNKLAEDQLVLLNHQTSMQELEQQLLAMGNQTNIRMLVIDDFHLLKKQKDTSAKQVWEENMITLQSLAKSLKTPVLITTKVKRTVETRKKNRFPEISDLAASDLIGQMADFCFMLVRPGYYRMPELKHNESLSEAILINRKNIYGGTNHTISLDFNMDLKLFSNRESFVQKSNS